MFRVSWLAQDNGGRRHSVYVRGAGRERGVWFCLCKKKHNNNILRCYGVPLTVQMEESVKFPKDINTFPTPAERKACVCLDNKLRKTTKQKIPAKEIFNLYFNLGHILIFEVRDEGFDDL